MAKKLLMKSACSLFLLLAILTLSTTSVMATTTWQQVSGDLTSSLTSFYVYNGTLYVACTDASGKDTVMEYVGASWQPVGDPDFSSSQTDWVSLFVYDGTPYLAYRDDNDLKFTVMNYDGRAWTPVGTPVGIAASPGYGSTIYDSFYVYQGIPYLASEDGSGSVTVMKCAGDSAGWQPVGDAINYTYASKWVELGMPGYPGVLAPVSLVVYEGTPYVAARNTVMKYNGTAWEPVGSADFLSIKTDYESLCVHNGMLYVAYQSQSFDTSSTNSEVLDESNPITSGVMEYNGASWVPVGNNFVNSSVVALFVADDGTLYVACTDASGKATVMEYDGASWQPVGNAGFSSGEAGCVFLFVYDGIPYLAYDYIDANGDYQDAVMEYTCPPAITTPVYAGTDASVSGTAAPDATIQLSVNGTQQPAATADASGDWTVGGLTLYAGDTVSVTASAPAGSVSQTATALVVATSTLTEPAIQVDINGSPLQMDVSPTIVNGRAMVPLRAIFQALGAAVQWNPDDRSIVATKGNTTIKLQIGSASALNNGAQVTLDAAPQIVDGRTLLPVRFVGEAFGAQVNWDAANRRVNIVTTSS